MFTEIKKIDERLGRLAIGERRTVHVLDGQIPRLADTASPDDKTTEVVRHNLQVGVSGKLYKSIDDDD